MGCGKGIRATEMLKLCFLSNAFHSQNAEVFTTILTQMLLSLFLTSQANLVSGIGIANKIETKQLQCTRVQTTAIDSEGPWGSAVSSPSGVWGGAPAEIEF